MKIQTAKLLLLILLFFGLSSPNNLGFETDQYNLPKEPLGDIGIEVSAYVEQNIKNAILKLNQKVSKSCETPSSEKELSQRQLACLKRLNSEEALAKAIYDELGKGSLMYSKTSDWIEAHQFENPNSRYKQAFAESIYVTAPLNAATLSSTIRMYEVEFGTDKIAHIFQQGFDYFEIYQAARRKGQSEDFAIKKAIKWGQMTENTYFGFLVSGVYSNADLAANYAGFRFYKGLTQVQSIDGNIRKPISSLVKGLWKYNQPPRDDLLKPFISQHLNEARNPNKFLPVFGLRSVVRSRIKSKACKDWKLRFPNETEKSLKIESEQLQTWFGEDYGFANSKNFVTIADSCFSNS